MINLKLLSIELNSIRHDLTEHEKSVIDKCMVLISTVKAAQEFMKLEFNLNEHEAKLWEILNKSLNIYHD